MEEKQANIRERAGNHLLSIMLLSSEVVDGATGKVKLAEHSLKDLNEVLSWLTKSGKKQHLSFVRKKAIDKIKEMQVFCARIIENKIVTVDMAIKTMADVEEIRNWLDQRQYKTKSKS